MKRNMKSIITALLILITLKSQAQLNDTILYHEHFRPQVHFSSKAHWMNDPNGMVYFNHTYHLFFQYYPNGTTWGPMHWGHAISKDLIHWKELPIALYPDSLGYIFSGSAVVDSNNTSGLGKGGKIPLVAIFTHDDPKGERAGRNDFQNESIAYSLDDGFTWTKYSGNPVLKNPGIRDFRDPSVMWYAPQRKWIMTLATKDRVTFYSSPNLKNWEKESDFGSTLGAHTGVWECPNLFLLKLNNKTHWVLTVSVNPGGPNGGSATQYFIGDFDGKTFTSINNTETHWVDYGPDDYAGVTWSNTGNRKIFLGWMSNWTYAGQVPTEKWRNDMTIPRVLGLKQEKNEILLTSMPVKELKQLELKTIDISPDKWKGKDIMALNNIQAKQYELKYSVEGLGDYKITLSNDLGDKLVIGYNKTKNAYYIDRTKSGITDFNPEFAKTIFAPRLTDDHQASMELVVDASSIEVFADNGLSVLTSLFFPHKTYNHLVFKSEKGAIFENTTLIPLKSIW